MAGMKCSKCNEPIKIDETQLGGVHVTCPSQPDAKPTDLELLVVDFGDVTLVKAVKGNGTFKVGGVTFSCPEGHFQTVQSYDFETVRKAIEGEKPDIRLEHGDTKDGYRYLLHHECINIPNPSILSKFEYEALSQLAGKPLPIYTGGTWEQLAATDGVTIWKFTR